MNLPSFLPSAIGAVVSLLTKPTPKKGKKIRNFGAALTTIGGAVLGVTTSNQLPEIPESWIVFVNAIAGLVAAIGTVIAAIGQSQIKEDPDRVL